MERKQTFEEIAGAWCDRIERLLWYHKDTSKSRERRIKAFALYLIMMNRVQLLQLHFAKLLERDKALPTYPEDGISNMVVSKEKYAEYEVIATQNTIDANKN